MAELRGGTTIGGYTALHSGLKEAYLSGNVTMVGKATLGREQEDSTVPAAGAFTERTRMIIYPPYHTGGPWYVNARDDSGAAYLDFKYAGNSSFTIRHNGLVQIMGNTVWHAGNDGSGSGLDADTVDGIHAETFMRATNANGYYGLTTPAGSASEWVRTTVSGIIPYQSGGASALGTSSWPFGNAHINAINGSTLSLSSTASISGDITATGTTNTIANLTPYSTTNDDIYTAAAIEIREYNKAGAQTGSWTEAPRIGFHWGGRVAAQIGMSTDGTITIRDNPGTGYGNFMANDISAAGGLNVMGAAATGNLTVNGDLKATGIISNDGANTGANFIVRNSTYTTLYVDQKGTGNLAEFRVGVTPKVTIQNGGNIIAVGNITANGNGYFDTRLHAGGGDITSMPMMIKGHSNGAGYIGFYDITGATRWGYVGFASGSNSNMYIYSDSGDVQYHGDAHWFYTTSGNNDVVIKATDSNIAALSLYGDSQGSGRVFVGQTASYGGGMQYNGDNTPAMATSTDQIGFFRTNNGTDYQVFGYGYGSDNVYFESGIVLKGKLTTLSNAASWNNVLQIDNGSHGAITNVAGNIFFGMHSNGNFYWSTGVFSGTFRDAMRLVPGTSDAGTSLQVGGREVYTKTDGIKWGTAAPSGGSSGDIYIQF